MKSVTVIVPAYNEEKCVDELASRLKAVFNNEPAYKWQVIIVENGSTDHTWGKLQAIAAIHPEFRILRLSRNFRMDGGLTAGLEYVDSDACILMTADLQDPPELIPTFLRRWEEGYENIYGVVQEPDLFVDLTHVCFTKWRVDFLMARSPKMPQIFDLWIGKFTKLSGL
jgi:glycosyltransferase involved in cell wall biosynthesis